MSKKPRKTLFLDRTEELQIIKSLLVELLAGRPIERPIRYFYGVPMVGKTSLLHEIKGCATDEFGVPNAYIDFDSKEKLFEASIEDRYKDNLAIFNLVEDIRRQLEMNLRQSTGFVDDEMIIKDFLDDLRNNQKLLRKPLVLLFDTLEEIDINTFKRLQNGVLMPLLENRDTLIIFAARAQVRELPISFDWSMRRQLKTHPLRPFTRDETDAHFKRLLKEERSTQVNSSKELFEYTNGIPGLNEFVVYNTDNGNGKIITEVIERAILDRAPKAQNIIQILTTISACRLFDTELLAYLVRNLDLPISEENEQHLGTSLLVKLLESTLVEQRVDGAGYVVVEDLRRLIYDYLREINPQRVLKTHKLALHWFEGEVTKGDIVLLVDLIYHQAGIWFNEQYVEGDSLRNFDFDKAQKSDRLFRLKDILNNNLETLKENPRASMLIKRIKEQLSERGFEWFLNKKEIKALIETCNTYQEAKSYSLER